MIEAQVPSPGMSATSASFMIQQLHEKLSGFEVATATNHKAISDMQVRRVAAPSHFVISLAIFQTLVSRADIMAPHNRLLITWGAMSNMLHL